MPRRGNISSAIPTLPKRYREPFTIRALPPLVWWGAATPPGVEAVRAILGRDQAMRRRVLACRARDRERGRAGRMPVKSCGAVSGRL